MSTSFDDTGVAMAYVLLSCAHGSDGKLGSRERNAIVERLAGSLDVVSASDLEHALSVAVKQYGGADVVERGGQLQSALDRLKADLSSVSAERFVRALIRVVDADEQVLPVERDFVLGVAQKLGVAVEVAESPA
ncbi:MAG: TerB family tellurite resistance protein [Myxococcales bacterium FL481]|nr:MAG: TerB family tellurite resistance protein [Myxococcales bacterium FL481]